MKTKKRKNRKKKNSKKTTKKLLLVLVPMKELKILKKNPAVNTTPPTTDLTTLLKVMTKKKDLKKPQLEDQDTLHLDHQVPVNKKVPTVPFPTTVTLIGTSIPPHGLNTRETSWTSSLD